MNYDLDPIILNYEATEPFVWATRIAFRICVIIYTGTGKQIRNGPGKTVRKGETVDFFPPNSESQSKFWQLNHVLGHVSFPKSVISQEEYGNWTESEGNEMWKACPHLDL